MKTRLLLAAAGIIALTLGIGGQALATYSQAPSWMPMTMPSVTFDTVTMKLNVTDVTTKHFNTNTAASGTGNEVGFANFEPGKPWSVAQGTAFSRQFGWNDPNRVNWYTPGPMISNIKTLYNDPGAGIWIEETASSPGLNSYYADGFFGVGGTGWTGTAPWSDTGTNTGNPIIYAHTPPYYTGIFGTDGSSQKWQWDGRMDHNLYTIPWHWGSIPDEIFFATYKVYVGDAQGREIFNQDGSSTATIKTWTWQAPSQVPVPEPSTFVLLGAGLVSLVALKWKRS
jgi:hypothetical protein